MNKISSQIEDKLRQSTHMHWVIVGAVMFTLVAMWGSTYNSYSLFVTPVQESLRVSRPDIVLGVTVKGIGSILGSYLCAFLLNKMPVMKLLRLSAFLLVGNLISLSLVQNLLQYYAVLFVQAVLTITGGFIPLSIIEAFFAGYRSGFYRHRPGGCDFQLAGGHLDTIDRLAAGDVPVRNY